MYDPRSDIVKAGVGRMQELQFVIEGFSFGYTSTVVMKLAEEFPPPREVQLCGYRTLLTSTVHRPKFLLLRETQISNGSRFSPK